MTTVPTDNLLHCFSALLDEERIVISDGDYEQLTTLSHQKIELLQLLKDYKVSRSDTLTLQAILRKSTENELMVEAALRFWRGAHQKLMHRQNPSTISKGYSLYQKGGN
ncbi:flagellar protein FlgN [Acidithiobacillus thiooxidans]|uniref:hypothetical protein n=1 Tax=Acidithiobacillus thiooxidans TaxID=930 RepID=UPI001C06A823|nr:hypothetical protein [Acidithiobacillus thiooxidans]MBU2791866.1 flagellar protein FlgN [Acidithiobacillus thiooxidans]